MPSRLNSQVMAKQSMPRLGKLGLAVTWNSTPQASKRSVVNQAFHFSWIPSLSREPFQKRTHTESHCWIHIKLQSYQSLRNSCSNKNSYSTVPRALIANCIISNCTVYHVKTLSPTSSTCKRKPLAKLLWTSSQLHARSMHLHRTAQGFLAKSTFISSRR